MANSPVLSSRPSPSGDGAFRAFIAFLLVSLVSWAFYQNSQLSQPADPVTSQITVAPEPVVAPPAVEADTPTVTFEPVSVEAALPTARVLTNGTLYGMAKRLCGDGRRWREITMLNSGIDPGRLQIGQELKLPADCQADARSVSSDNASAKQAITRPVLAPPKEQPKRVVPDVVPSDDELLPEESVTVEPNPQWPTCDGNGYTDEYFVSTTRAPRLDEMSKWVEHCRSQAGAVTADQLHQADQLIAGWEEIAHFTFIRPFMGREHRQARVTIRELRHSKRSNAFDASYALLVSAPVPDLGSLWSLYGQRSAHSKWARTFFPYVKQYGKASDEPIVEEDPPRSKKRGAPAGSE